MRLSLFLCLAAKLFVLTASLPRSSAAQVGSALATRASSGSSSPASHISEPELVDQGPGNLRHTIQRGQRLPFQNTHRYRPSSPPPSSTHTTETFSPPRRPDTHASSKGDPGASTSHAPPRGAGHRGASTSGAGGTVVSPPRWRFHPPSPSDRTQIFGPAPVRNPQRSGRGTERSNRPQRRPYHSPDPDDLTRVFSSPRNRGANRPQGSSARAAPAPNRPSGNRVIRTPIQRPSTGSKIANGFKKGASKLAGCLTGKGLDCTR